jgi:hypothetical protein
VRKANVSSLLKPVLGASAALLMLSAGQIASAAVHSQAEALSPRACGAVGGSLADPADTQRCLAERYKPPKPTPAKTSAPAASSNAASAPSSGGPAASVNPSPPASQGQ